MDSGIIGHGWWVSSWFCLLFSSYLKPRLQSWNQQGNLPSWFSCWLSSISCFSWTYYFINYTVVTMHAVLCNSFIFSIFVDLDRFSGSWKLLGVLSLLSKPSTFIASLTILDFIVINRKSLLARYAEWGSLLTFLRLIRVLSEERVHTSTSDLVL